MQLKFCDALQNVGIFLPKIYFALRLDEGEGKLELSIIGWFRLEGRSIIALLTVQHMRKFCALWIFLMQARDHPDLIFVKIDLP